MRILYLFTKFSPNLLHFDRELSLIFDTFDQYVNQPFLKESVEVYTLLNDLNSIYAKAYNNVKFAQSKKKIINIFKRMLN